MTELINNSIAINAEKEIAKEIIDMCTNGEMDELIDKEIKNDETLFDKILNFFVKN